MSKSTELLKKQDDRIYPKHCPVCGVETNYINRIVDSKSSKKSEADWYSCQCGVIFQKEQPAHKSYNLKYAKDYIGYDGADEKLSYSARIYAPLIEELTMGRMVLDVGFCSPFVMDFYEKRGWLTWGIDMNTSVKPEGNIYKGSFEDYDFSLKLPENAKELGVENLEPRTFDLIWMSHVFEHFKDPLGALRKAYDLLPSNGTIFISTPDIEFIYKTGVGGWPHWGKDEHYIMWSERALIREVERCGFKVVMCRRNYSSRFSSWFDIHMICQKNYF